MPPSCACLIADNNPWIRATIPPLRATQYPQAPCQLTAHSGLSEISQHMTVSLQKLPFGLRRRKVGCTGLVNTFLAH